MKKSIRENTDWTRYYSKPKSFISYITQRISTRYLIDILKRCKFSGEYSVLECGGGRSCFVDTFKKFLPIDEYDILDNCKIAIDDSINNININNVIYRNLLDDITEEHTEYDLVFSVGLVEHFDTSERLKIISNHFKYVKNGGYCLITAPTPTFKYRLIRKAMELFHVWQFWDEVPQPLERLIVEVSVYGKLIFAGVNRSLPLTQCVVIVKKEKGNTDNVINVS